MIDEGLKSDTCVSIKDGPPDNWWLSPSIVVRGFDGQPVPAGAQNVDVTVDYSSSQACTAANAGSQVKVELFVCIPSMVIPANDGINSIRIGRKFVPYNNPPPVSFPWTVSATSTGPDGPGHKCLIARAYPEALQADESNLAHCEDDQHYAQKNLCIVACNSPCGLDGQTANLGRVREAVTLRAVADLKPSRAVLAAVMPALRHYRSFRRFSPKPPPPFKMVLDGFREAKVRDRSVRRPGAKLYGRLPIPNYEVDIVMRPKQIARFHIGLDMEEVPFGDAFLFHLTHRVRGQVRGGLSVVFVRAKP